MKDLKIWKLTIDRDWGIRGQRRYFVLYFQNRPSLERQTTAALRLQPSLQDNLNRGNDIFSLREIAFSDVVIQAESV